MEKSHWATNISTNMTDWSLACADWVTFFWPSSNSFRLWTCSEEELFFFPPWRFRALLAVTVGVANLSRRSTSSGSPMWLYSAPSAITNNHFHENDQSHQHHRRRSSAAAWKHTSLDTAFLDFTRHSYCFASEATLSLSDTLTLLPLGKNILLQSFNRLKPVHYVDLRSELRSDFNLLLTNLQ